MQQIVPALVRNATESHLTLKLLHLNFDRGCKQGCVLISYHQQSGSNGPAIQPLDKEGLNGRLGSDRV